MASVTHSKVSGLPNTDPSKVGGEDWDAAHVVVLDDADIPSTIARDTEVTTAVSNHAGAADPHTGYRLESADHSHATTGLQGGTVAHSALTGLTTGDPHTQYVQEADASWIDLTDGGATTLHTHAGGAGAPTDADYLVGTANASLSNEIVVGTSPGGELGGTWASPTVDATHAGSTHVALGTSPSTQAFGDAAAGGAATDAAKTDHKHAFPALGTTPSTQAFGDAAAGGSATTPSKNDHKHAMPTLGFGLTNNATPAVSLTTASAFATATTSVSAATYADVTGVTVTLAAGTWLVIANCYGSSVNAQALMHIAITDASNAILAEGSQGIGASGSASVAQLGNCTVTAIVTATGAAIKMRAARGLTTLTGTWVAMDGAGTNTLNNLTDGSDKGTGIFAIRIA